MVKIRFSQAGKKNQPFFRIVAADEQTKRDGKIFEILGFYDPKTKPETLKINMNSFNRWLGQGAQPTEGIRKLLKKHGKIT